MKKLLVACLLLISFVNVAEIKAEEPEENEKKACVIEVDDNGEILNLEEYQKCISELIEPYEDGKGDWIPRV